VFFGTAELAAASLRALAAAPAFCIQLVVTQPDRPRGRSLRLQPSPVKATALDLGLPVAQPDRCRAPDFLDQIRALAPALIVVAAYGQILPPALLELPRFGCLNVHASLLPRHRGAAPIQWAIIEGDSETGVTVMRMDAGLDTGDLLTRATTPIQNDDTAATLHDRLAELGAVLLVRTIPGYVAGEIQPRPQPAAGVTYARKITKEDGRLDWSKPATELERRLRAFTPWPGAFTFLPPPTKPVLLKIWHAVAVAAPPAPPGTVTSTLGGGITIAAGIGALVVTALQREGGRRLAAADFLAGHPIQVGTVLG
jgi:methionyl-tRNA formyltransferase